jgi:hypothetical protein
VWSLWGKTFRLFDVQLHWFEYLCILFLNIFCKRQISIKLFYLYQRLQCRDNYFFKIKFAFFLYLQLSASWKENDLPLCIYFWYQTDSGVPNTSIYSCFVYNRICPIYKILFPIIITINDVFVITHKRTYL